MPAVSREGGHIGNGQIRNNLTNPSEAFYDVKDHKAIECDALMHDDACFRNGGAKGLPRARSTPVAGLSECRYLVTLPGSV